MHIVSPASRKAKSQNVASATAQHTLSVGSDVDASASASMGVCVVGNPVGVAVGDCERGNGVGRFVGVDVGDCDGGGIGGILGAIVGARVARKTHEAKTPLCVDCSIASFSISVRNAHDSGCTRTKFEKGSQKKASLESPMYVPVAVA